MRKLLKAIGLTWGFLCVLIIIAFFLLLLVATGYKAYKIGAALNWTFILYIVGGTFGFILVVTIILFSAWVFISWLEDVYKDWKYG